MIDTVLDGYARDAERLIPRFEAISPADLYAPVSDLLPSSCRRIADIGAGTGRDAAWFADRGSTVLAVEPVMSFRSAGGGCIRIRA